MMAAQLLSYYGTGSGIMIILLHCPKPDHIIDWFYD